MAQDAIRTVIGVCPQHDILFDQLTVREHLQFFGTFVVMYVSHITAENRSVSSPLDRACVSFLRSAVFEFCGFDSALVSVLKSACCVLMFCVCVRLHVRVKPP